MRPKPMNAKKRQMLMHIKDGQFIHDLEETQEDRDELNSKPIQKSISMTQHSSKFLASDVNPLKLNF